VQRACSFTLLAPFCMSANCIRYGHQVVTCVAPGFYGSSHHGKWLLLVPGCTLCHASDTPLDLYILLCRSVQHLSSWQLHLKHQTLSLTIIVYQTLYILHIIHNTPFFSHTNHSAGSCHYCYTTTNSSWRLNTIWYFPRDNA